MSRKFIAPIVILLLCVGALFYSAKGRLSSRYIDTSAYRAATQPNSSGRRMVDMVADDSYLIDYGDSTVFILVGNFAAHHNGAVILADSAVRYSNQSFECFGNVLINQNTTYIYGDSAEYDHRSNRATIFSELIKVVDGDAVMYTYNCTFDTAAEMGEFYGGCYVEKGESLMESERGYYNTATHDLIAVERVEMRDEVYQMTGDSVIFNTETEDARYFRNTNIWNDKEEYLFANRGTYTKARDLHHLTKDAYLLSPEREVWSDSIEYYRTDGHIIGRTNIQVDDTTQKIIGFADYGEWWDEPGNALFTRRPSMINYDPQQPDSLFLCADTLWMYTIAVGGKDKDAAQGEESADTAAETQRDTTQHAAMESLTAETTAAETPAEMQRDTTQRGQRAAMKGDELHNASAQDRLAAMPNRDSLARDDHGEHGAPQRRTTSSERTAPHERTTPMERGADTSAMITPPMTTGDVTSEELSAPIAQHDAERSDSLATDVVAERDTTSADSVMESLVEEQGAPIDTLATDTVQLTERQMRYRAKLERRRQRDTLRAERQRLRDSLNAIRQAERDSIRYIEDSLLRIKLDTIIAKRRAQSARIADEEKARMERIKQKAEERRRRKIDKAKARALRRGVEYTGEDYELDTLASAADSLASQRDTLPAADSLAVDSLAADSLARDTLPAERPIPADSAYKMIKAYGRVKMYRSDSQMVCDSMVILNTDSVIRLYIEPILWNEQQQVTSDSMAIHTRRQRIEHVHFMGDPIMSSEIDTTYYNQVKGKSMKAYFEGGALYRNDVDGNAQTIYYMQEEENSTEVSGLMYIESAAISFYFLNGEIDKITYKQNPEYVLYPMEMIPETQELRLPDFDWYGERRPLRDSVVMREIRPSRRNSAAVARRPQFPITERIDYDRRRLVENQMWEDRVDELSPEVIEWRNSRSTYKNRE